METKLTINELVSKVLAELERLNYSYNSLCGFRALYKRVIAFANKKEKVNFSEELGREFLKEKYNCIINYYTEAIPRPYRNPIRKLFVLYFEVAENWKGTDPKRIDPTKMHPERANLIRQAEVAKALGCHRGTLSKLTRLLHDTGWVTIKRTGRTNIIILHGFPKRRKRR